MRLIHLFKNFRKVNGAMLFFARCESNHWLVESSEFQRYSSKCIEEHQQMLKQLNESEDNQLKRELHQKLSERQSSYNILNTITSQRQLISQLQKLMKDEELKELAREDLEIAEAQLNSLVESKLVPHLLPAFWENIREINLELSAGVGGSEAMLFSKDLLDMYLNYCAFNGWKYEIQTCQKTETGGIRHASVSIEGEFVYDKLKFESGVHRVQRIPLTENTGRVHTSTASVVVLPQPSQVAIEIQEKDLKVETKRASGAGGQHVNKTESAIRMTHLPSGLTTECQTSRSQLQNRAEAKRKLQLKLYQIKFEEQLMAQQASRKIQVGTSGRSEKIRTYNFMQDRITDHRININVHNLKVFMNGQAELGRLIDNLSAESQREIIMEAIRQKMEIF